VACHEKEKKSKSTQYHSRKRRGCLFVTAKQNQKSALILLHKLMAGRRPLRGGANSQFLRIMGNEKTQKDIKKISNGWHD
jgi:hypothetical protein